MSSTERIVVCSRALIVAGAILISMQARLLEAAVHDVEIQEGRGQFEWPGNVGEPAKKIVVSYHRPKGFTSQSPVLIVLPGAGRNASDYRDAWIKASERFGVLILSPEYSEDAYPGFQNYNLAGMITDLKVDPTVPEGATYKINTNPQQWIFGDMDRIFLQVRKHLNLEAETYDVFGHSAGGQVAHRLALFQPTTRADRIVAANSGWYSVPTLTEKFPYGIGAGVASEKQLRAAFSRRLVVMLGELDDENETRGDLMRTPQIDVQGLGRIERGRHFFRAARKTSEQLGIPLRWSIEVIPNVGHDFRRISDAAAEYLYGNQGSPTDQRNVSPN